MILDKKQTDRLNQLAIQFDAPMTMVDPRNAGKLDLSDDQIQQIHEVIAEKMPRPQGGPGGQPGQPGPGGQRGQGAQGGGQPGMPPQGNWKDMMAKKAEATKAVMAILTSDQKATWAKMTGKAFTAWEEPKRPGGE